MLHWTTARQSHPVIAVMPGLPYHFYFWGRKRAYNRAVRRASAREDQMTWHRGGRLHLSELGRRHVPVQSSTAPSPLPHRRPARRLRIMTYNCGGLSSGTYQEILVWLKQEAEQGRPIDIACVQETAWREDFEFRTSMDSQQDTQWFAVHSGGPNRTGLLCLIRTSLLPADHIRYVAVCPGRLLHIRLMFATPLDILCVYQVAWNPGKTELNRTNKVEELVKQRARLWAQIEQWFSRTPLRHGALLLGDLNTPLRHDHPVCGPGLVPSDSQPHKDQEALQALLRRVDCRVLNTWGSWHPGSHVLAPECQLERTGHPAGLHHCQGEPGGWRGQGGCAKLGAICAIFWMQAPTGDWHGAFPCSPQAAYTMSAPSHTQPCPGCSSGSNVQPTGVAACVGSDTTAPGHYRP